jgi:hypothetical protein
MQELYAGVVKILCEHRILNQDAMVCLQAIGFDGFALMHKCRAKDMQCFELDVAQEYFSIYRNKFVFPAAHMEYEPMSLKEHLALWKTKLEDSICDLKEIHKRHLNETGLSNCIIMEVISCMECDYKRAEGWYKRFVATSWLVHDQYTINDKIALEYKEE